MLAHSSIVDLSFLNLLADLTAPKSHDALAQRIHLEFVFG